jgi:predicted membrane protein
MNYMNYVNNMWGVNTLVLDCIDNWDIVTLCFITPIKEVCLNWQNFIGYRIQNTVWRPVVYVPKSSTTFCEILICVMFRPSDM